MGISNISWYGNVFETQKINNFSPNLRRKTYNSVAPANNNGSGFDTVSISTEARQQMHNTPSSKPLEEYQIPRWLVEASSPHCLYKPTLPGESYVEKPRSAETYDSFVSDAFHNALTENGVTSENYYENVIKNPEMSEKIKNDMYSYLQQNPKAMELMRTWNPGLFSRLA